MKNTQSNEKLFINYIDPTVDQIIHFRTCALHGWGATKGKEMCGIQDLFNMCFLFTSGDINSRNKRIIIIKKILIFFKYMCKYKYDIQLAARKQLST